MRKGAILAEELIANWELGRRNGGRPISVWAQQGSEPWETCFSVDEVMPGTTWKQYKLPVASSTTDTHAQFIFGLGQTTGTVYTDDIQLQTGSREVWRRDYSGGTVLVNAIVERMLPKALWEYDVDHVDDPTYVHADISWSTNPDDREAARRQLADIIEFGTNSTNRKVITPLLHLLLPDE